MIAIAQADYQKAQKAQERRMHAERADRRAMTALDHKTLHGFRDEFDRVSAIQDENARGMALEPLVNKIFDYYGEDSKGPVRRVGEQIDGTLKFDSHWHYVEIRWKAKKTTAQDISVLRDRAKEGYGGDTKALFISMNGYTSECLQSLVNKSDERVILMDGYDLRCVLNCDIALDVLLAEKQAALCATRKRSSVPWKSYVRVWVGLNERQCSHAGCWIGSASHWRHGSSRALRVLDPSPSCRSCVPCSAHAGGRVP